MISNLWNAAANTGDGHYVKESSLLTCTTISKTLGIDINMHGVSMDQLAAQRVGDQTPLAVSRTGHRTRVDRCRYQCRIHASVRLPHRLEQPDNASCPRDQSLICLRAPVSRRRDHRATA